MGPNGAGKTTVLRALLGLIRLSSGWCSLLGERCGGSAHRVMARTGSLVEVPRFPASMSARRVLEIQRRLLGVGRSRVSDVLELVGLDERADDRVGGFSLGMRQRLGLAVALLGEPAVLVLDEPANGLDPPGIRELRALLRRVADTGVLVFVSSHLLGEVEQISDTVTVVSRGRCVYSGPLTSLQSTGFTLVRTTASPEVAAQVLRRAGWRVTVVGEELHVAESGRPPGSISRTLAEEAIHLVELRPVERSLDDAFAELVGVGTQDSDSAETFADGQSPFGGQISPVDGKAGVIR